MRLRGRWCAGGLAVAVLVAATSVPADARGAPADPRKVGLAQMADEVREATNAPGAIVAVQVRHRRGVIVARGTRDRRATAPLRPDDAFVTASVSKAFTAAAVNAFASRGRLDLQAPVARYVRGWDPRIRVRQLLDHSSGLPSWGNKDDPPGSAFGALVSAELTRRFTMAESIAPVRAMPLLFAPGSATHYSNANSILAGLVVEAVTGAPLAAAYHRHVLDPLHLRSTGYAAQETPPRAPIPGVLYFDAAKTIEVETTQYPLTSLLTLAGPSVAMVSNAPDLLRFADGFLRGDLPTRRLAERTRRIDAGGAGLGILGFARDGYCIFDGCPPGQRFDRFGFAGNADGVAVRVVRDPRRDVTVLVFANSSQRGKLDAFVNRIFALTGGRAWSR